jgi:hypothetical protein
VAPSSPPNQFVRGDYVTISDEPFALTWEITAIDPHGSANGPLFTLVSGQSGRKRYETADALSPYRRFHE